MPPNNELLVIKRKLHNLKREQKAFRTVGLILGALLICWLPFFVTLPIVSIQQHQNENQSHGAENTWFKIVFWLGYCNSAVSERRRTTGLMLSRPVSGLFFSLAQPVRVRLFQPCYSTSVS